MPSKLTDFLEGAKPPDKGQPSLVIGQHPFTLDLERINGNRLALPYSSLLSISLDPSKMLIVIFASHVVTITGVNLRGIYEALARRSAGTLIEIGDRPGTAPEREPAIYTMDIANRHEPGIQIDGIDNANRHNSSDSKP